MKQKFSRTRVWIALIALILLAGLGGPSVALAKDPTSAQIQQGMLATVKLWLVGPDGDAIGTCSGTVIDPAGYILTNFHCVGYTDLYGPDDSGFNLSNGDLYNPDGLSIVGPTTDPKQPPKPTYIAQFLVGNTALDVAVVKIVKMLGSDEPLPNKLPLVTIKRSDSNQAKVGDFIAAVGYPGVGGPLVSYLPGQVSGFDDQDGNGDLDSFKTSANINPGNSGGLGMNDRGEQIGIATWGIVKGASKIDRFKMINIAEPLIQEALQMGGVSSSSQASPGNPPPPSSPPPSGGQAGFGKIQFGTEYKDGKPVNPGTAFPSGTKQLDGVFSYAGMKTGTDWGFTWSLNGKVVAGKATGTVWKDKASGTLALYIENNGKPLPDGSYKLTLYIGGKAVTEGTCAIGAQTNSKPPTQATPPSQNTGVVLKGQIVDADTQRGVSAALFSVLKPGVSIDQFVQALDAGNSGDLIDAFALTDQNGNYQTVPALARGQKYSVVILAKGYQPRAFENALEITADDPGVVPMKPIALQKR